MSGPYHIRKDEEPRKPDDNLYAIDVTDNNGAIHYVVSVKGLSEAQKIVKELNHPKKND